MLCKILKFDRGTNSKNAVLACSFRNRKTFFVGKCSACHLKSRSRPRPDGSGGERLRRQAGSAVLGKPTCLVGVLLYCPSPSGIRRARSYPWLAPGPLQNPTRLYHPPLSTEKVKKKENWKNLRVKTNYINKLTQKGV